MADDILFSGVDGEVAEQVRLFCEKNDMPYKILLELFAPMLRERDDWNKAFRQSDFLQDLDRRYTRLVASDPVLGQTRRLSVVQRYFGLAIKPLTKADIEEAHRRAEAKREMRN